MAILEPREDQRFTVSFQRTLFSPMEDLHGMAMEWN